MKQFVVALLFICSASLVNASDRPFNVDLALNDVSSAKISFSSKPHTYVLEGHYFSKAFSYRLGYQQEKFSLALGSIVDLSTKDNLFNHTFLDNALLIDFKLYKATYKGFITPEKAYLSFEPTKAFHSSVLYEYEGANKSSLLNIGGKLDYLTKGGRSLFSLLGDYYIKNNNDITGSGYRLGIEAPFKLFNTKNAISINQLNWSGTSFVSISDRYIHPFFAQIDGLRNGSSSSVYIKTRSQIQVNKNTLLYLNLYRLFSPGSYLASIGAKIHVKNNLALETVIRQWSQDTQIILKMKINHKL
jgi:hypothetical protein